MSSTFSGGRNDSHRQHWCIPNELGLGLRDTAEKLRASFEQRVGERVGQKMAHQDVRAAILTLLTEESMHGYQIIHEIEKRSEGTWKPTPGSVYPTLQLLVDQGLLSAQETDGKKSYSLTDTGTVEAESGGPAPWEQSSARNTPRAALLPKAGAKLAQAAVQVSHGGTPEQVDEAVAVIDEARRKLYAILAQD